MDVICNDWFKPFFTIHPSASQYPATQSNLDFKELTSKYEIPKNLFQLIENEQSAFLALKIVEILGEDEPYQLDPESIYFITSLLNDTDLIKFRNKVLISALPQRI